MSIKESNIEKIKSINPNHAHIFKNTWKLYDDEPNEDEFKIMIEDIASQNVLADDKRTCVISGFGSQPKMLYTSFKTIPGVSV